MARKYLVSIDLSKNELQNAVIQNLAAAPGTPAKGQVYFDTVLNIFRVYDGTTWQQAEVTFAVPGNSVEGDVAAAGSSTSAARADHVHGREAWGGAAVTQAFGDAAAAGAATTPSRSDHKHGMPADPTGKPLALTGAVTATRYAGGTADIAPTTGTFAIGDFVISQTGKIWVCTAAGTPGTWVQVGVAVSFASPTIALGTAAAAGAAATAVRSDATIVAFDVTAPTTSALGDAAAVGTATVAARRDHVHGREALGGAPTSSAVGDAAAAGAGTTSARVDHVHGREAFGITATASAVGDTQAPGTATTPSRSDHKHAREAFGVVTAQTTMGAASATGVATTIAHSDHTHGTPAMPSADQLAAQAADYSANSHKVTNLLDPTNPQDAATKAYVDARAAGLDVKQSVAAASTANVVIATGTLLVIDGYQTVAGDRILLKNQTTPSENGIYIAGSGAWARATDFNTTANMAPGSFVFVEAGTANASAGFVLQGTGAITPGTTAVNWTQFSGAGEITVLAPIVKTGNQLSAPNVPTKFAVTIGDGATTAITVTHNLNTRDVVVAVYDASTNAVVDCDVVMATVNTLTLTFAVAPATNAYRVVVIG
ncbi:MAG: hypothetical protein ABR598_07755 [Candidatus Dormibacteria bacterium]